MVKQAYQQGSILRGTCRRRTGVVGDQVKFPTLGRSTAQVKTPQADVIPANVSWGRPVCTLENWHVAEYTDIFDDAATNVDERAELAMSFGMALGRREDQWMIDALKAVSSPTQVTGAWGSTGHAKLADAKAKLMAQGVAENARICMVAPATRFTDFAADDKLLSKDYQPNMPVAGQTFTTPFGIDVKFMDTRSGEGGVDKGWVYEYFSMGVAIGIDARVEANYVPVKTSTLTTGLIKGGATVIDASGMIEVTFV